MPRWSLCLTRATLVLLSFVVARPLAAGTRPQECALDLVLRFDRPFATPPPRDWAHEGLNPDFDALDLIPDAERVIKKVLSELPADHLRRALLVTPSAEQTRALALAFEVGDLSSLAKDARWTARHVLESAVVDHPGPLGSGVESALAGLPLDNLRTRARRAYADVAAPLAHELRRRVIDGRLRLTIEDGLESIALDPVLGAPDRLTFELAKRLTDHAAYVRLMPARDQRLARTLMRARINALAAAWATDHYATLSRITYTEPVANGYVDRPIKDFIVNKRFYHPHWWEDHTTFAKLMDQAEGRPIAAPARITGQTSRSPLAYLFGRDAERRIYWPAVRDRAGVRPELTRMSLNDTLVNGRSEAVELLVNDQPGACPRAYYFLAMEGDLVPTLNFNRRPIERACVGCHADQRGGRRLTFNPFFLKSAADLHRVGYRNDTLIEALRHREAKD